MADPTGETDRSALRLDFDRRLMLQFRGSTITSDAGLLAYRELDNTLQLTDTAADKLADERTGKNGRHRLVGLLRQAVFGRLAGYEDVNDAERLCRDPAMRWVVGARAISGSAASASQMGRFETKWLSRPENLTALADLSGQWIDKVRRRRGPKTVILDMDSSESPTYGEQEGSAYNGHFACTCYHPLFVFNQFGDVERCVLRPGNVHSADGWRALLEPVIARYRGIVKHLYFRGDAAFANPEVYEFLEAEGASYTIRLPANQVLQDKIGHLLKRPVGRPPPCCMDRRCERTEPDPCSGSCDADVLRAPQLQHSVQHADGDGHLTRLSPVRLRPQPLANDALPARHIRLHQGAPVIP